MMTQDEIMQDIKNTHQLYGRLTRTQYLKVGKFTIYQIKKYFKTWNEALQAAGIDINMYKGFKLMTPILEKEYVKNGMLNFYKKYGYIDSHLQRKYSGISQGTVDRLFGSYQHMLKEIGIERLNKAGCNYTNEEIFQILKSIYAQNGCITSDLIQNSGKISRQTLHYRFGSPCEAVRAAGLRYGSFFESFISFESRDVFTMFAELLSEFPHVEYIFPWLRNPKTDLPLRCDTYFEKHNLVVEYHGDWHFKENNKHHHKMSLEDRQYLDEVKRNGLKDNGIKIIEYTSEMPKTYQHMRSILQMYGI